MANEGPRLSTADLRRRLHTGGSAPAGSTDSGSRSGGSQFAIPASLADLPVGEDAPTFPIPRQAPEEQPPIVDAAPVVPSRFAPAEHQPPPPSRSQFAAPPVAPVPYVPPPVALAHAPLLHDPAVDPAVEQLRQENAQLHQLMEEMRQLLQDASEQEQRVQSELTERDAKLATAAARIEELETAVNTKPKTKGELEEWADELERESFQIAQERRMMEADRKQLREDESSLEKQMREMEVQMARERAMLARQEQELKRLNAEIQHELEVMQRGDGTLRERLAVFQRRHAEVIGGAPPTPAASYYGQQHIPEAELATVTPPPRKADSNSLLRKLFRSGD